MPRLTCWAIPLGPASGWLGPRVRPMGEDVRRLRLNRRGHPHQTAQTQRHIRTFIHVTGSNERSVSVRAGNAISGMIKPCPGSGARQDD
jgi:hypothetical protein